MLLVWSGCGPELGRGGRLLWVVATSLPARTVLSALPSPDKGMLGTIPSVLPTFPRATRS